jgi:hypothetical protein
MKRQPVQTAPAQRAYIAITRLRCQPEFASVAPRPPRVPRRLALTRPLRLQGEAGDGSPLRQSAVPGFECAVVVELRWVNPLSPQRLSDRPLPNWFDKYRLIG